MQYTDETYGERIAEVYDEWYQGYAEAAIDRLAELSNGGRALELGIGTGRIAIPLVQRGVEVHGIDASPAMVEKLRSKPGGERIPITIGSFAHLPIQGNFSLIYVVFNTFFGLLTQDEQVSCFQSVSNHLEPDGNFVLETFVPNLKRYQSRQNVSALEVGENQVRIDATQIDPASQIISNQHMVFSEHGIRLYPVQLRYVYPPEMDLMARLAGLRLRQRWENWEHSAFTADSTKYISVYGKF